MGADSLVVGLAGSWPSALEIAWLQRWKPFGVILFSRNVTGSGQLKDLCSYLRTLVPELEIMADHEGGPVSQLAVALGRPPSAWTLGHVDDVGLTRRVHERTAELMVAAGVSWVLAPCADVMSNSHNPVIGVRAFGSAPDLVSRHVQAAVEGLLAGGIKVCLKHWPGHGSAGQDSHLVKAVIDEESMDEAVAPFHAGLAVGATAVMVGHLCAGNSSLPATLDSMFLDGTRKKLAAQGNRDILLMADDITMGGLRQPMAGLGVKVFGDSGEGLLEPDVLPKNWFQVLEDAGCNLLLIRGLPLKAFPVDNTIDETGIQPRAEGNTSLPVVGDYQESRLRAAVGDDFFRSNEGVLWVDLTVGDRWAVAAGCNSGREVGLETILEGSFAGVGKVLDKGGSTGPDKSFTRVVLVSHRPLSWDDGNPPGWLVKLAENGQAVVMGHPSLEEDFIAALPALLKGNWLIIPVYDVTGADLRPGA